MCVWLALVLMLTIFHHPGTKTFCLASFLERKKDACCEGKHNLFLARKLAEQKFFVLGW
jgi:hypothetical protein